jgi:hypothetical protein
MSTTQLTKCCSNCKQELPDSGFYRDKRAKDGLQSACKHCQAERQRQYRRTEQGRETNKRLCKRHNQRRNIKASKLKYRITNKDKLYAQSNRWARSEAGHEYKEKHALEITARYEVNKSVKSGRIAKPTCMPCARCVERAAEWHHWAGYEPEHWFDIMPLCIPCHTAEHHGNP